MLHRFHIKHLLLSFLALFMVSMPAMAADQNYQIISTTSLPGEPEWDYLSYDVERHHLFITHGDHVDVWDTDQKKIVGTIAGTNGVHGVALAPDINRGYTSNGIAGNVTVFELSSLKILGTVPAELKPDAIVYDAISKHVFAANGRSNSLSVIDVMKARNMGNIALGGKPEFAVVDGKGKLFVNLENKNQIAVIDTEALRVIARYDISKVCDEPAGLAIDTQTEHLFAGCHSEQMAIIDGNSGKIITALPIDKGNDAVTFDNELHLAFASNGNGTLTVVGEGEKGTYKIEQVLPTIATARTMALDPVSHHIYLIATDPNKGISLIEVAPVPKKNEPPAS